MSKLSTLELRKRLITILEDLTGEEVKPESKLDDFSITLEIGRASCRERV